jgi:hypothetical protein
METILDFINGMVYLGWRAWLLLRAFDQRLIWALFSLLVLIVLSVRVIRMVRNLSPEIPIGNELGIRNSVETWVSLVGNSLNSKDLYHKWCLAENLFSLYSRVYYECFGINRSQLKRLLKKGEISIPEKIAAYLQAGAGPFSEVEKRPLLPGSRSITPLDINPKEVVEHLEELYENDI